MPTQHNQTLIVFTSPHHLFYVAAVIQESKCIR